MISADKETTKTTLRIGIMCNGLSFAAWEAETIRNLINTKSVSLELLIGNSDKIDPIWNATNIELRQPNIIKKIIRRLLNLYRQSFRFLKTPLWSRYERFVNKHFTADCDKQISMRDELIDVDMIYCRIYNKGKYSQYFTDSDLDKIKSYNLDVILRFGFNIIRGKILNLPTYGVWSFHHGDYLKYRGGPPGFWEIYNKDPWSGAILQRLTDKLDDGIVLYSFKIRTDFSSYKNNKNKLFWGTTKWPAIVCRNILFEVNSSLFNKSKSSSAPVYTTPNYFQLLNYFIITIKHRIKNIFRKRPNDRRELWALGIIKKPVNKLINTLEPPEIRWIEPPEGQFYADPFLIKKNKASYIFFEDYSYKDGKGRISYIVTKDFETFSDAKPIIETMFHLSYPSMVENEGKYYCIPEQYSSGEVALYEATSFPDKWEKKATLLKNFSGVDPTILKHDNLWWMFIANHKDNDSSKLYLFYSEKLEGPWQPHKNNPVKIYPNMTRPAGAIFKHNGMLIRPAQNCRNTYGGSTLFYEIIKLSSAEFKEILIGELFPKFKSKYPDGLHHIMPNDNITIIDGKRLI